MSTYLQPQKSTLLFQSGMPLFPSEFADDFFATGEIIPGTSQTFLTTLKFLNFTSEFDKTEVQCGSSDIRTFVFGFPGKCLPVYSIL